MAKKKEPTDLVPSPDEDEGPEDWEPVSAGREEDEDEDEDPELDKQTDLGATHYAGQVLNDLGPPSAMGAVEDFDD